MVQADHEQQTPGSTGGIPQALTELADELVTGPAPMPDQLQHVHLINATLIIPSVGPVPNATWQVPLTHVGSWTFGRMSFTRG